jgi:predicted nucleotidyltransferase
MSPEDLEHLVERLRQVLEARPEIREAYLFGSRARGGRHPESDTDVAVYLDRGRAPDSRSGFAAELAAALMTALGRNDVEVVVLNDAPPLLYHRVLRDGIRLLARSLPETTEREGRALSRYCDYVPQLRKIDAAHAARIARGDFGR